MTLAAPAVTFGAPAFLYAAGALAAAVVALHLLVLRPPPAAPLPTARFVPTGTSTVRRLTPSPRDRVVLALRALTVLLAGAAFARPVLTPRRAPLGRIVALDRSSAVASPTEARDSAARYVGPQDVLVVFDSTARVTDSLPRSVSTAAGSLSAALAAVLRTPARADSLELVVISPFTTGERDAATAPIRQQWPGAIHTVRVAAAPPPTDTARIMRATPTASDSAWARAAHHTLVAWPAAAAGPDTVGAVAILDAIPPIVAVAPFTKLRPLGGDSGTRIVARWVDGAPAATDRALGAGCVRDVAIGLPTDTTPPVRRLIMGLTARACGGGDVGLPLSDSALRAFAGQGPTRIAALRIGDASSGPLATVLLVLAIATALAELLVRR